MANGGDLKVNLIRRHGECAKDHSTSPARQPAGPLVRRGLLLAAGWGLATYIVYAPGVVGQAESRYLMPCTQFVLPSFASREVSIGGTVHIHIFEGNALTPRVRVVVTCECVYA